MDDIEVWLRTDLVRLDFYLLCVGCGKPVVLQGQTSRGLCRPVLVGARGEFEGLVWLLKLILHA